MVQLGFLKNVPVFIGLPEEKLKKIQEIITEEQYAASEIIIKDGDHGETMYILLDGEVSISKKLTLLPSDDEHDVKDKVLIKLSARHYAIFGEMALFEEKSERSATVGALTHCKVGTINRADFLQLVEKDSELGAITFKNIAIILSERLKKANKDIVKLTTALSLALG
ncbi:cyclic nucleotide-binding protein [Chloroherpeton thalassium ATCC 35110]|uniref:Cyclic nucleotide-binding protein n=1 Tax=Chloroherpeton thalassium (strain ATCC 35110 / GB-78) TaxID=517418 RepID=B3QZ70_CHLT3|nr:cyclic nucleotide-binding protein [Chloroherpeton thalassium ATCC 35110]